MTSEQIEKMTDRLLLKRASNLKKLLDIKHRMQHVCAVDGVEFINDSKSTHAASAAYSLYCMSQKVIWIVDARLANQDISELDDCVQEKVKKIIVIGPQASILLSTFPNVEGVAYLTLGEAIEDCKNLSSGNQVLFSPSCPAGDEYKDFRHRGEVFIELVEKL